MLRGRVAVFVLSALCAWVAHGCGTAPTRSLPLQDLLLGAAHTWGQGLGSDQFARAALDQIAERVRQRAQSMPPHRALADVVFRDLGFVREVEDESLDYVFLPSVLEHRRGSCVGLGALYLVLAERLGWRMHGVLLPGHFYVVLEERGERRSIELLREGAVMPEGWHRERFMATAPPAASYARALRSDEVLGVVEYDVGNQRKRQGRLFEARRAYESARKHFSEFGEAHASAAAVAQLLGELDYSLETYRAAQRVNPGLPGVAANLALLVAERDHGSLAPPP